GHRPNAQLLDLDLVLIAAARLLLLLLLVLVLPEVHDAAHRGPLVRGDLDEVELLVQRQGEGVGRLHDAELLVVLVDDADLADADVVVDARAAILRNRTPRIRPAGHESSSTSTTRGTDSLLGLDGGRGTPARPPRRVVAAGRDRNGVSSPRAPTSVPRRRAPHEETSQPDASV